MLPVLALLFTLSGASALIYQVVWLRMLSLVFGVTVHAASTVLACFMAGLALGSFFAGRIADRVRRPIRWFGATEILIALTALSSPLVLQALTRFYVPLTAEAGPSLRVIVRIVCCAVVLLPPTVLMGATLPLVLRSAIADAPAIGARIGVFYGLNTAGAIAGAVLAGYALIGSIGMNGTLRVAAALNGAVGLTAVMLERRWRVIGEQDETTKVRDAHAPHGRLSAETMIVPVAFAVSGMTALALEVIWFRTLVLYFPATTYAFTAMLASVLGGIAGGSLLAAPILRRKDASLAWLGVIEAAIGATAVFGCVLLATRYDADWAGRGVAMGAALAIVPTALLMGAAFPTGLRLWVQSQSRAGQHLGLLYSVNLAGAIAGSLVAGFLVLPRLGSARSLSVVAGVNVVLGILILASSRWRTSRSAVAVLVLVVAAYATAVRDLPDPVMTGLTKRYRDAGRIFFRDEGIQTTVSVHVRELGGRQLFLDGLHQASDGRDVVRLHRQIGHLPVMLHRAPERALVIGLGGGTTAGAVSLHPKVRVDILELAPGVVKAASWFTHVNEGVLHRPNVTLYVDDARNFLLIGRHRYDVITADIIQPTHAGAGLLYSQEYFTLARRALNDGGVMVQWVGPRSELYYKLIARTFQSVFPDTTVWVNGSLLIGSTRPLVIDRSAIARRFVPPVESSLSDAGLGNADALVNQYTAGPEELRAFLGDGPVLTDDKPVLEYYLSLPQNQRPLDLSRLGRRHD